MFNAVVDIKIAQVKCIRPVVAAQHVCGIFGDEEAKAWGKIVGLPDRCRHLLEANTATGVGQYSCEVNLVSFGE